MFTVRAYSPNDFWDVFVQETINGETRQLKYQDTSRIGKYYYRVPGYTGTKKQI